MGCAQRIYQPRHAEAGVLHGVIREHLDDFLRAAADRADGGTVGRVALGLGREWIGVERDPRMARLTARRLKLIRTR